MDAISTVNAFAEFVIRLAWIAMLAAIIIGAMYQIGTAMQRKAHRRTMVATKRGYQAAGKPVEPHGDRRNRAKRGHRKAA